MAITKWSISASQKKPHCVPSAETASQRSGGSFLFGRIVNAASRWSRLVAGGRPSAPKEMNREADRDRHFAVAAPLARWSICDDRTEPIWWHVGDAGQGAGAERAGTGVLSLQARNHRGDRGVGRAAVDRRSEKHLPRSHCGGT